MSHGPRGVFSLSIWLMLAIVVSVATLVGSLYLSLGMNLRPCPLCYYQRTFALAIVGVLAMGLITMAYRYVQLSLFVLPLAIGGLGIAGFHVYLELSGKLECPAGILGILTAPKQSLLMYALLTILLLADVVVTPGSGLGKATGLAGGVAAGVVLAVLGTIANPPLPNPPNQAYDGPPVVCRPPYRATE